LALGGARERVRAYNRLHQKDWEKEKSMLDPKRVQKKKNWGLLVKRQQKVGLQPKKL